MDELKHKFRDFINKHQVCFYYFVYLVFCFFFVSQLTKNRIINNHIKLFLNFGDDDQNVKIPSMGFSDSYVHSVSTPTPKAKGTIGTLSEPAPADASRNYLIDDDNETESALIPDQEILDATEEIYFHDNVDTGVYELNVCLFKTSYFSFIA